jgi:membrane protease YdiL (CAAX protease family)
MEDDMITNHHYKPGFYYGLTFLLTFGFWLAGAYASHTEELADLYFVLMLPGLLAPFMVTLAMTLVSGNRDLKRDYLKRLFDVRLIRLSTLPVLVLLMPLVVLASALLSLLVGESVSQFQPAAEFSFSYGIVSALTVLLLAATFEELGWRGYAFDSLQSRYNYFTASIIFGVLWSAWHLPLLLVKGSYQYEILQQSPWYAVNFYVGIVVLGIIISWFCAKNSKSVPAAIAFHFVINMSQEFLAITQVTKTVETGVLAVVAAAIVLTDKELFFSRSRTLRAAYPAHGENIGVSA